MRRGGHGSRLAAYRKQAGMSGHEFAAWCGVHWRVFYALESGERSPVGVSVEWRAEALRIAERLGVTCDVLWPDARRGREVVEVETPTTPEEDCLRSELRREVLRAVERVGGDGASVLVSLFGLDGEGEHTDTEVARERGVSKSRIGAVKFEAFRKVERILRARGVNR